MSEDEKHDDVATIEARRAERKAGIAKARAEQYGRDVVQVDRLEQELGDDRVAVLKTPSFVAGLPTVIVVKTPTKAQFARFRSQVQKSKSNSEAIGAAQQLLGDSCVIYPEREIYDRMLGEWPALQDNAGLEAIRLGEAEGKG
jgi:hypothetical protein